MSGIQKAKRNIKDSFFTSLFSRPRYSRELYECLTGKKADGKEIAIVTCQNILCNGIYNDLGFVVGEDELFIVEAQSTTCPNIIYRINDYYLKTLKTRSELLGNLITKHHG